MERERGGPGLTSVGFCPEGLDVNVQAKRMKGAKAP